MQLGMVGLGRMGANLVRRLTAAGHTCVVYDVNPAAVNAMKGKGVRGAHSIEDLVAKLTKPAAAWVMVPAAVAGSTVETLASCMAAGDIIVDGGNSYYRDDIERARTLASAGIHYVDCGTSGGVFGLERGYCLMIGGEVEVVHHLDPIFKSIAPGVEAAARTPGRSGEPRPAEQGYLHCGPHGAGHFVKMVHNGIEYGLMAAYAEGLNILKKADSGLRPQDADAETSPLREPAGSQYQLDIADIAEVWRRGSVVASWLLDLTAAALVDEADFAEFSGRVSAPVIATALFSRFESRGEADYADRLLSAMRKQFGGHDEKPVGRAAR